MPTADYTQGSLSTTLLGRLRRHEPEAWERLVALYSPLVYGWCRRAGLSPPDAADVLQDVFRAVARGVLGFRQDRPGDSFRGWLAAIARNKIRDHFRRDATRPVAKGGTTFQEQLANLPDPAAEVSLDGSGSGSDEIRGILHRAVELIRAEFEDRTWQAFWKCTVDELNPADTAAELGISVNAVYKAKSRVLRRLRDQLDGL